MKVSKFLILAAIFLYSCDPEKSTRILVDNQFVEGNIFVGKDTLYNGLIKFYDTVDNSLSTEAYYVNDTLNGEQRDYYPNGQVQAEVNFKNGNENGSLKAYDTVGNLFQLSYYYYGLQLGPLIRYKQGKPTRYSFYTFDGIRLFLLEYDSVDNKTIEGWKSKLFFHTKRYVVDDFATNKINTQYFLYLPDPPDYKFEYSFCVIDSSNKILRTLKYFNSDKIWTYYINESTDKASNEAFAFRLQVYHNDGLIFSDIDRLE